MSTTRTVRAAHGNSRARSAHRLLEHHHGDLIKWWLPTARVVEALDGSEAHSVERLLERGIIHIAQTLHAHAIVGLKYDGFDSRHECRE